MPEQIVRFVEPSCARRRPVLEEIQPGLSSFTGLEHDIPRSSKRPAAQIVAFERRTLQRIRRKARLCVGKRRRTGWPTSRSGWRRSAPPRPCWKRSLGPTRDESGPGASSGLRWQGRPLRGEDCGRSSDADDNAPDACDGRATDAGSPPEPLTPQEAGRRTGVRADQAGQLLPPVPAVRARSGRAMGDELHRPHRPQAGKGRGLGPRPTSTSDRTSTLIPPREFVARTGSDLSHACARLEAEEVWRLTKFAFHLNASGPFNGMHPHSVTRQCMPW